jgi:hypothetical protein
VYRASIVEKKRRYLIDSARRFSGIIFTRYAQNRNFKRANNLNVFGTNKTKGPKQDSQNRPWQPIPAGANNTSFDKNCII